MSTREERSRWLVGLLRQALAEDRSRKIELHTVIERAVEYGGSAVEKPSVSEFARMMRERLFDHFDPDFYKWTQAVAWNLRLEPDHSVGDTITVMEEMGFTVIPPAAKRYEVLYNGVHVAQFDSPSHAETLSMGRTGYKVIDHGAAR